jgi:hypothetical protein
MPETGPLEERVVEVHDPKLSDEVNLRLTEELREVIGTDRVRVPADRPRVSQGENPHVRLMDKMTARVVGIVGFVAIGAIVGLLIALTHSSWWLTGVTVFVLLVSLFLVTSGIIGLAGVSESPDPSLLAWLGEQGVNDPELLFTELVHEFTPSPTGQERTAAVEDDPARASVEQRAALTATGGASSAKVTEDE